MFVCKFAFSFSFSCIMAAALQACRTFSGVDFDAKMKKDGNSFPRFSAEVAYKAYFRGINRTSH